MADEDDFVEERRLRAQHREAALQVVVDIIDGVDSNDVKWCCKGQDQCLFALLEGFYKTRCDWLNLDRPMLTFWAVCFVNSRQPEVRSLRSNPPPWAKL